MPRPLIQQPLHDGWRFRAADPRLGDTEQFTTTEGWQTASVPGTIYQDLIASGAIPDPLVGRQEAEVQWVAERDWCYRLDFDLGADALRDRMALVFDGLDTFARVWLDGQPLAESDNMFVPLRVDITDRLPHAGPSRHTLWIRFDSALRRGRDLEAHHGARPLWNGDSSRLHVRKAPYHYGWDWGPTLLTCGPWKAVHLEAADLRIAELASPVTLSGDWTHARVDLHTRLGGDPSNNVALEHALFDPAGTLVATHHSRATAQHTASLSVDTPQLWWPAGHGAQPLYTLHTRLLRADGTVIAAQQRSLGLRRLRLVQDAVAGEAGRSFVFEVNGRELFCGGANWIPDDNLLNRITPARYRERVQQAVDANLVMLRVWGGGIYEDEAFYDACDALGVLVWQDFVFACGLYPAHPAFVASVEAEARAAITRLRHRASLAIWCGNNEDYTLAETVGALGSAPGSDPTRFEARAIYEQVLPTLCHALDPGRPYWPGSPYTPPASGTGQPRLSQDATAGDRHSWEVWHQLMLPYQRYAEVGARFVSEFGMQSHPSMAVLDKAIPAEERFPGSRTLQWHNKASSPVGMDGHRRLAVYRADTLRHPDTLAAEVYATQFVQAEAMRHAYEAFRRRWQTPGARACGGALVWQLNDCWPVTSWAVIDSDGRPKPAWHTIRRAMAPLACAVRRDDAGVSAWAVNGTDAVLTVQARWQLLAIDGEPIDDKTTGDVSLAANAVTPLTPPPAWFADRARPLIARLTLTGPTQAAQAHAWPEPFRWHRFPDPQVQVVAEPGGDFVQVSASRPAKGVWLEAPDGRFEDNFLDLLPGEVRRLRVSGSVHGILASCLNTWQDAP
jgi:beta-mannosidase